MGYAISGKIRDCVNMGGADSVIGGHCIINTGAMIDHECKIGDFVHVGPGVHCGGRAMVNDDVWIGIGASVINDIRICRGSVIGAGAAVVRDITDKGLYVGVPAKVIEVGGDKKVVV